MTRPSEIRSAEGVRVADLDGAASSADPRLAAELAAFAGLRLSEFAVSASSVRLLIWDQEGTDRQREITVRTETLAITAPEGDLGAIVADSETAVRTYLAALNQQISRLQVDNGELRLSFEHGVQLAVDPDPHYEGWEITSGSGYRDGLVVVCVPGGGLSVWLPQS